MFTTPVIADDNMFMLVDESYAIFIQWPTYLCYTIFDFYHELRKSWNPVIGYFINWVKFIKHST